MADRISANKQDEIVKLYHDGLKIREIAQEVGVGSASVFLILERRGIKPNRQPRANARPVDQDHLLERLAASDREIGRLEAENRRLQAALDQE